MTPFTSNPRSQLRPSEEASDATKCSDSHFASPSLTRSVGGLSESDDDSSAFQRYLGFNSALIGFFARYPGNSTSSATGVAATTSLLGGVGVMVGAGGAVAVMQHSVAVAACIASIQLLASVGGYCVD